MIKKRIFIKITLFFIITLFSNSLLAKKAAIIIDFDTQETLFEVNADTLNFPASLTKMMTLYIAFDAIKRGEISLDTQVKISSHAASEPPSKLGMRPGQTIALRYLIRGAAVNQPTMPPPQSAKRSLAQRPSSPAA